MNAVRAVVRRGAPWRLALVVVVPALGVGLGADPSAAQSVPDENSRSEFLRAARAAIAHGDLAEAESLVAARPPNDAVAAAVRGHLARRRGDYAEAERLLVPAAGARPTGEAAYELGLLMLTLGRTDEASASLTPILAAAGRFRTGVDMLRAAQAARALGRYREANRQFRRASGSAPDDPAVNTAWGELFFEKYNKPDASESFRTALGADAQWAPAHLGMARVLMDENRSAAEAALARALEIDPELTAGHLLAAEMALDAGQTDQATAAIEAALDTNPASLEARALLAAMAYVEDRLEDFDAEVARALAINPAYGEIFRVAGSQAAGNYRFEEAASLVRRAIELSPGHTRAYADLGMHLLRTGDEAGARAALERSFESDPFDVVTFNLLSMLETLDEFETIRDGDLIVRLDPDEAPVLGDYVVDLAHEALDRLSTRYDFTPRGPILIEVFPRHDDFAVRNVGLPGMVGALGACFGRVVTLDSPRARPPGEFNWQATLWHELAHVITLQMSNQRVPRWLTEGISVYEETRARPEWGRDQELSFVQAIEAGEVLALRDLNAGFTRIETISLAYYQASVLVEHLVERFGEPMLHELLRAYGDGLDTEAALDRAAGVDLDDVQASFDDHLEQRFGALRRAMQQPAADQAAPADRLDGLRSLAASHPGSFPLQFALGRALQAAGDLDAAAEALERAIDLVPMAVGSESPYVALADIAIRQGDRDRAMRALAALLERDHTNIEAARRLAALAEEARDVPHMRLAYERIVGIDPFDTVPHAALGRLALDRGDAPEAIREFRAALATGPIDSVVAHCDLAQSYLLDGRPDDARRHAIAALEIAPTYARAQELLLEAVEAQP